MNTKPTRFPIVSSITVDQLVSHIWEMEASGLLKIPQKLSRPAAYGPILLDLYRPQDIKYIRSHIAAKRFDSHQLIALDAISRWLFVNSVYTIRSAIGLICCAINDQAEFAGRQTHIRKDNHHKDSYHRFASESVALISQIFRDSVSSAPVYAKIPYHPYIAEYTYLKSLSAGDREHGLTPDRQDLMNWIKKMEQRSDMAQSTTNRREFAACRLIQVVQAIAGYKHMDHSDMLRNLIGNCQNIANIVRIRALKVAPELSRLAADVLDYIHSLDRMLGGNCVQARIMLDRMAMGDLIYDEALSLGRIRHQTMVLEFPAAISMFAYMLKEAYAHIPDDGMLNQAVVSMLKHTNAEKIYNKTLEQFKEVHARRREPA